MATTKTVKDPEVIKPIKFNFNEMAKNKIIENESSQLYVNAFPITFKKDINVHQYPFTILPETTEEYIISRIFSVLSPQIHVIYGNFYRSGKSFYAVKEVLDPKDFSVLINDKGKIEYRLQVDKKMETTIIKEGQKSNFSMIEEKIIFLIIREILTTNPNIKVDKDNFYLEKDPLKNNYPQKINGAGQSYFIYEGYKLSLKQTENGLCLIIGIKNRIKGDLSVYDALKDPECNYGEDLDESIENLVGKRFIPDDSSKSKVIADIDPERTPSNTSRNYGKESYSNYIEFFKKEFNKEINYADQPMILVKFKGPEGEPQFNYYVPEFSNYVV